jgi:hypothetical protein
MGYNGRTDLRPRGFAPNPRNFWKSFIKTLTKIAQVRDFKISNSVWIRNVKVLVELFQKLVGV